MSVPAGLGGLVAPGVGIVLRNVEAFLEGVTIGERKCGLPDDVRVGWATTDAKGTLGS